MDALEGLADHLHRTTGQAKIVVWAHNSHLGDARATQLGHLGELNLGQLVRERHGSDAVLIGFTTFTGTVTAATHWGDPPEEKLVRPALPGSYEALLHAAGLSRFLLHLTGSLDIPSEAHQDPAQDASRDATIARLAAPRLERAIGVIYLPESERESHYFHARLAEQFDALIHIDETRAVEPLEETAPRADREPPETYPTAM
jgi:erythromycin esterase-like protein